MSSTRQPAVAGAFYPGDVAALRREIDRCMPSAAPAGRALAVVAPHAGYRYSGPIAGETYARVEVPSRVVVMCPNHTGRGSPRSIWLQGNWRIPGADVPVDEPLARAVAARAGLQDDREAHLREHAIEVHLPFLVARRRDVTIVPVCLGHLSFEACREVGEGLAAALGEAGGDVMMVASTDMSHYVSATQARERDLLALERVLALDAEGLYRVVHAQEISMCGVIPTTVALVAAQRLGARSATLVRYGNSGEASGDLDRVVGYAGVLVQA